MQGVQHPQGVYMFGGVSINVWGVNTPQGGV